MYDVCIAVAALQIAVRIEKQRLEQLKRALEQERHNVRQLRNALENERQRNTERPEMKELEVNFCIIIGRSLIDIRISYQ